MTKSEDKASTSDEKELHFVVALKRSFRDDGSRAKMSSIEDIDGVRVQGGNSKSNQVHAFVKSSAVSEMKKRLEEICFVEPVMLRETTEELKQP